MGLDTKYRPRTFDDVLGQEGSIQILKQYVNSGAGFHQSYVFSGAWGSGKTTLARILARALLCDKPVNGAPCDRCMSCRDILDNGTSECFFEIDAATNSGKDSIKKITGDLMYASYSGKHRLYLMDEAHRLSKDAFDAMLKPLEDTVPGSNDKQLVCMFCTTEPEAMRHTILSRCAPAFVIRAVTPDQMADRLAYVCGQEGIPYDREALVLIAELTECHFRDALKAVEGVSMLGEITVPNASKYLHLDYATTILDILANIKDDLPAAMASAETVLKTMSPITVYERLADMSMLAYRASLDVAVIPGYLDRDVVTGLGSDAKTDLLTYAERFSTRPGRPSGAMVLCDIAQLHRGPVVQTYAPAVERTEKKQKDEKSGKVTVEDKPQVIDGVYVRPRAVNQKTDSAPPPNPALSPDLRPQDFLRYVVLRARELRDEMERGIGPERRENVGDPGALEVGGAEGAGGDARSEPSA